MGFMCSWIAIQGVSDEDFLDAVQMERTERRVFPGEDAARFSFHRFPNGWSMLFSEDFEWASRERIRELSRLGLAVGGQYEDKIAMESTLCAAKDGVELWRVYHVNDPLYRLDVSGEPPAALEAIKAEAFRLQEEDGGETSPADYINDIPLGLAKAVTGYRFDEGAPDDPDNPVYFTALKAIGAAEPESRPTTSLIGKLLAPFGRR